MFLGIDIGTTATKAVLLGPDLRPVASAGVPYDAEQPRPGISEIDPQVWIDAVRSALASIRRQAPGALAATRAVGLSGQMHSIVVMGADERPLRPAILWNDRRGEREAACLAAEVPGIAAATGVLPMPSFSASKLLWLRNEEGALFSRIGRIAWAKDYVRHWLTGEWATDMSDAAGAQLLDEARRGWFRPVLERLEIGAGVLPRLLEGSWASGSLRGGVAAELGLPCAITVAAGGGDAATAALGLGCVEEGRSFLSLGTGAVIVSAQASYRPAPDALLHAFAHCVPDRWYAMAAMLNGASCLAFVSRLCNEPDVAVLLGKSEALGEGPGRVLFQPYLRGERTPHNDIHAKGAFVGLDAGCGPPDLVRAVLEGVAFSLRQGLDALRSTGAATGSMRIVGGGARSAHWCGLIATILEEPLLVSDEADVVAASGAARLAALSIAEPWEHCTSAPVAERVVDPSARSGVREAYSRRYEDYLSLYPSLAPVTRSLRQGPDRSRTVDAGDQLPA